MPNFGALADLFGAISKMLSAGLGFLGSLENPLPPFLSEKGETPKA